MFSSSIYNQHSVDWHHQHQLNKLYHLSERVMWFHCWFSCRLKLSRCWQLQVRMNIVPLYKEDVPHFDVYLMLTQQPLSYRVISKGCTDIWIGTWCYSVVLSFCPTLWYQMFIVNKTSFSFSSRTPVWGKTDQCSYKRDLDTPSTDEAFRGAERRLRIITLRLGEAYLSVFNRLYFIFKSFCSRMYFLVQSLAWGVLLKMFNS